MVKNNTLCGIGLYVWGQALWYCGQSVMTQSLAGRSSYFLVTEEQRTQDKIYHEHPIQCHISNMLPSIVGSSLGLKWNSPSPGARRGMGFECLMYALCGYMTFKTGWNELFLKKKIKENKKNTLI